MPIGSNQHITPIDHRFDDVINLKFVCLLEVTLDGVAKTLPRAALARLEVCHDLPEPFRLRRFRHA